MQRNNISASLLLLFYLQVLNNQYKGCKGSLAVYVSVDIFVMSIIKSRVSS